jgi:hypothetical protein
MSQEKSKKHARKPPKHKVDMLVAEKGKIKFLKAKNIKANTLEVCTLAQLESVKTHNLAATHITATNTETTSLSADNILLGGVNLKCLIDKPTIQTDTSPLDPVDANGFPIKPSNISQEVWDCLENYVDVNIKELQSRFNAGRSRIEKIYANAGCPVCPPEQISGSGSLLSVTLDQLTLPDYATLINPSFDRFDYESADFFRNWVLKITSGAASGEYVTINSSTGGTNPVLQVDAFVNQPSAGDTFDLIGVVLNIIGTKTYLPANFVRCENQSFFNTLVSISYDLDIVNTTENLSTRIVSILVQVVYEDPASTDPECPGYTHDIYYIGNRQFGATIDYIYGEKYTGVIPLKSSLIDKAVANIKDFSNSHAAIQLLVYAENGLDVFVPEMRNNSELTNVTSAVSQTATLPKCGNGTCRNVLTGNCETIAPNQCKLKNGECDFPTFISGCRADNGDCGTSNSTGGCDVSK